MTQKEKDIAIRNCGDDYDELLNIQYGEKGTTERAVFEQEVEAMILAERLKQERAQAGLSQAALARRSKTSVSSIQNIEAGHANVQMSTIFRVFSGLGHRVRLSVL